MGFFKVSTLASPQQWPASALILVAATLIVLLMRLLRRPDLPSGASWTEKGLPLFGSFNFFTKRGDFLREGSRKSPNGHFNFYYGAYPIIALSGEAARASYFTTRGLDLSAGFRKLFSAGPDIDAMLGCNMSAYFIVLFKRLTGKEHLVSCLPYLINDAEASFSAIDTAAPMDPFVVLWNVLYKMTHRTVGCHEVADDPALQEKTMRYYEKLDKSSAIQVMFPWLPTPTKLTKLWAGAKLHMLFGDIIRERRRTGRKAQDTMQILMDRGESDLLSSAFIIGALFAGLINTGVQSAWILCYLAHDPVWYAKVREEVDSVVAKYRTSKEQTPVDVLRDLSLEAWESEFPCIDLGVRDSIRLNLMGASIRQNTSGKDITIGDTGVVVPKDAFAVYSVADVHMDEATYRDPLKWDPARYLPDRAEDKKQQHGYIGWGTGLHPCLGMRIAKLELFVSTAVFFAMFDFKAVDRNGNPTTEPLPRYDANALSAKRMVDTVFFKCERRF
ncbi:cytochrome P450 monooxygenase [Trichoderma parareesei]|uniref:Cytochrome P450 monooxygenase n=1 Tax=Trichoderma parareesei TaxID=858221 RepID=A0A2H2ZJZ7_TRIPA|nr:cytochrome P450 monooxygenase [Trichoderma parareesei]